MIPYKGSVRHSHANDFAAYSYRQLCGVYPKEFTASNHLEICKEGIYGRDIDGY